MSLSRDDVLRDAEDEFEADRARQRRADLGSSVPPPRVNPPAGPAEWEIQEMVERQVEARMQSVSAEIAEEVNRLFAERAAGYQELITRAASNAARNEINAAVTRRSDGSYLTRVPTRGEKLVLYVMFGGLAIVLYNLLSDPTGWKRTASLWLGAAAIAAAVTMYTWEAIKRRGSSNGSAEPGRIARLKANRKRKKLEELCKQLLEMEGGSQP